MANCRPNLNRSQGIKAALAPSFGQSRSRILHARLVYSFLFVVFLVEIATSTDETKLAAWTLGGAGISGTTGNIGHCGTLGQVGFVARGTTNEIVLLSGYWHAASLDSFGARGNEVPGATRIYRPYPNPFNPSTTIEYSLAEPGDVSLAIYDVKGALVRQLISESKTAGRHEAKWSGLDSSGRPAASGAYFCRMTSGSNTSVVPMLLVR